MLPFVVLGTAAPLLKRRGGAQEGQGGAGIGAQEAAVEQDNYVNIFAALCLIGFFVGPTQPLFAELGVEVAFPASENLMFALQQIAASLFSAILAFTLQQSENPEDYSLSIVNWVMLAWLACGILMLFTFNATLKRPRHIMQVGA